MRYNGDLLEMTEKIRSMLADEYRHQPDDYDRLAHLYDAALTALTHGEADALLHNTLEDNPSESVSYCLGAWEGLREPEKMRDEREAFKRKYESIISG